MYVYLCDTFCTHLLAILSGRMLKKKKKKKKEGPFLIPRSIPKRPFPTFLLHVLHGYCFSLILFTNILFLTSTLLCMYAFSFLLYPYKLFTNFPQLSYYTTLILCYIATLPFLTPCFCCAYTTYLYNVYLFNLLCTYEFLSLLYCLSYYTTHLLLHTYLFNSLFLLCIPI